MFTWNGYVSRFRSSAVVLVGARPSLFVALWDLEDYSFSWMDPDFHGTIVELSSAHFLDCKLSRRAFYFISCREFQDAEYHPVTAVNKYPRPGNLCPQLPGDSGKHNPAGPSPSRALSTDSHL